MSQQENNQWVPVEQREKLPVVSYLRSVKNRLDFCIDLVMRRDLEKLKTLEKMMERYRGR